MNTGMYADEQAGSVQLWQEIWRVKQTWCGLKRESKEKWELVQETALFLVLCEVQLYFLFVGIPKILVSSWLKPLLFNLSLKAVQFLLISQDNLIPLEEITITIL